MRRLTAAMMLPLALVGARALAQAAAAPAAPPPGPGLELINQRCVFCHNSAQIFSQHKTHDAWAATVDQMANRGAELSPEEMATVTDYLAQHYGAAGAAAAPHS